MLNEWWYIRRRYYKYSKFGITVCVFHPSFHHFLVRRNLNDTQTMRMTLVVRSHTLTAHRCANVWWPHRILWPNISVYDECFTHSAFRTRIDWASYWIEPIHRIAALFFSSCGWFYVMRYRRIRVSVCALRTSVKTFIRWFLGLERHEHEHVYRRA